MYLLSSLCASTTRAKVKALEAQLRLQQAVQSLAVGAAMRIVDALVRAHDVAGTGVYGILKGPAYKSATVIKHLS